MTLVTRGAAINTPAEAALTYAANGWAVVPMHTVKAGRCSCRKRQCQSPGKHPRLNWEATQTERPSDTQLREEWKRWRDAGVGIVTGAISNLVVIDVDGEKGVQSLVDAGVDIQSLPDSAIVDTGRGEGAFHVYLGHPGHPVPTRAGVLPGVDVRADGGLVVAPPSTHASGLQYRTRTGDVPIPADLPQLMVIAEGAARRTERAKAESGDLGPSVGVATDEWRRPIGEGGRHQQLVVLTGSLLGGGLAEKGTLTQMLRWNADYCRPPLDEHEVRTTVSSLAAKHRGGQVAEIARPPTIVSATELTYRDFPEVRWAIPAWVPEGLTILAGRPKAGKSWLSLQLALSVVAGRNLVDDSECTRGEVLYLALEDSERRIHDRLRQMRLMGSKVLSIEHRSDGRGPKIRVEWHDLGDPDGLSIATEWPAIGNGCVEYLGEFLDAHPRTRLVIIDVIERITVRAGKASAYSEDYAALRPLHELARTKGVAILGVHHTRKAKSDDPVELVSGTFGLTGGADGIMVLRREAGPESREARLFITGRDIEEERDLALVHNADASWTVLGNAEEHFADISKRRQDILDLLNAETDPLTPKEIAAKLNVNASTTRTTLLSMLGDEQVMKAEGRYMAAGRLSPKLTARLQKPAAAVDAVDGDNPSNE